MNDDAFSRQWIESRFGKKFNQMYDATVRGKVPSDSSLEGGVRRDQVAYGVKLYRPQSRYEKGFSAMRAAKQAIRQFKDVEGVYSSNQKEALKKAILREYHKSVNCP